MSKTKFIKDVPVGVLIILLAQFILYGVLYLCKFPQWYELAGIILGVLVMHDMMEFGIKLIRGFDVELDSK